MRQLTLFFILILSLALAEVAWAAAPVAAINLYQSPNLKAKLIDRVKPGQRLVPIFQKKSWVKVGNPVNGEVGWINQKQYSEAVNQYYKPDIQTVFVHTEKGKGGHSALSIIAYKNGKKLSEKDAQSLYHRLRKEQQHEWKSMQEMNRRMDVLFAEQMKALGHVFGEWSGLEVVPPLAQPVIVINEKHK